VNREPRAWVLNLDAEHELEARGRYQPTQHVLEIVARERLRLLGSLVGPQDVVLGIDEPERACGLPGVAWSPTPRALAALAAAGAEPVAAPSVEVLRTVNARPFAALVREPLQRASFSKHVVATLDDVLAQLSLPAPLGWLVRRTFGAAGRGRRRISAGKPSEAERAWIEASLRLGPLVVEPWVEVTRDYTRSAFVDASGRVRISAPCLQQTTKEGAWTGTELAAAGDVAREDDLELERAVVEAGAALARAGYFGPFGIDAYRHRAQDGSARTRLNPLSEINARYTMDWALALL